MGERTLLSGASVVITRDVAGNKLWKKVLERFGANVFALPTIETIPLNMSKDSMKTLENLGDFDWLIFTSAKGVQAFQRIFKKIDFKKQMPRVAVVGARTAESVRKAGFTVDFIPSEASAAKLGRELKPLKHKKVLLLQTAIASAELPAQLRARNALVTEIALYNTTLVHGKDDEFEKLLGERKVDYLIFASPSAVRGFCERVSLHGLAIARIVAALSLGPSTSAALKDAGFEKIHYVKSPSITDIVACLCKLTAAKF